MCAQCGAVGIGGFVTGGGAGFSTGKWGYGSDNLISATVVLANGDIVEASDTENPDLFWGIRGGKPTSHHLIIVPGHVSCHLSTYT